MIAFVSIFLKYTIFYFILYFVGRAFVIVTNKMFKNEITLPSSILFLKSSLIYPIIGLVFVGNFLILINFILPLNSIFVFIFIFLFCLINFTVNKTKSLFRFININTFFYYIFIPCILLVSTYSISFHYDAGFYHLNHQNWLRESNMILGMINIFWAYGMSSIYEYISAILWFDNSFVFLHFLNLIFVHFFLLVIWDNLLSKRFKVFQFVAFGILIVSLLDNFGLQGGRNGYIYLDAITKQDVSIGILFFFISIAIFSMLNEEKINDLDGVFLSLITLFVVQIKISSIFIFYVYIFLFLTLLLRRKITFKKIVNLHLPFSFFASMWLLKSYFTTGCLIFPFTPTCKNNFSWYQKSNTRYAEITTSSSSMGFIDYMHGQTRNITDWFNDVVAYEFYFSIFINFVVTVFILLLIRNFFFEKKVPKKHVFFAQMSLIFINGVYLAFFGPIPRYSIGITLTIFSLFGFYIKNEKYILNKTLLYVMLIISTVFIVRVDSYKNLIDGKNIAVFDPRLSAEYIKISDEWFIPKEDDQCWINIDCLVIDPESLGYELLIDNNDYFKVARKKSINN